MATLVDIDVVESDHDFSSQSVCTENTSRINLHPDLIDINFNLYSDETNNVPSNAKCLASPLKTDCDMMNTVVSEVYVCKDNSKVTESPGVNKSQETGNEVKGELSHLQCSVKVVTLTKHNR